jgi:lysophospholipase L1-like esterase
VQAGTNDFGRAVPWEDTVASLRRILSYANATGKKVLVLEPIWRANENTPNSLGHTLNTYRFMIASVCKDEYPKICHFAPRGKTIMGTKSGAAYFDSTEISQGKQLHPNAMGHRKLADWIKSEAAAAKFF